MRAIEGVRIAGIRPELLYAMLVVNNVFHKHGKELIFTSIVDGEHIEGSLHYVGQAFDCRIWYLGELLNTIVDEMRDSLGEDFDVILEQTHIHVEFQPKRPINITDAGLN